MSAMRNRYRAGSVTRIRDRFGFMCIENGPPIEYRYSVTGIGSLQPGTFIRSSTLIEHVRGAP